MRFYLLIIIFLPLYPSTNWAQNYCIELFQSKIEEARQTPLSFQKTHVVRRNNNQETQQFGDIQATQWIDLRPITETQQNIFSDLALTKEGRVYHVLEYNKRRIAHLLSGRLKIKEIFLYNEKILVAVDNNSKVYIYSPLKLQHSPKNSLVFKTIAAWAASSTIAASVLHTLFPETINLSSDPGKIMTSFIYLGNALNGVFTYLYAFDYFNTYTNGLVKTDFVFVNTPKLLEQLNRHTSLEKHDVRSDFEHNPQDQWKDIDARPIITQKIK